MYQDYEPIYQPRVIDVDSIFSMFDENELAAEEELKHQLLCVSGTVYEVSRDMMDQPYVGLATSEGVSHKLLRCYISSNPSDDVMSLEKGDRVSCFLEITDKDTFDINAKLWNIEHYNEDVITDSDRNQNNGVEVELKMASVKKDFKISEKKKYKDNLNLNYDFIIRDEMDVAWEPVVRGFLPVTRDGMWAAFVGMGAHVGMNYSAFLLEFGMECHWSEKYSSRMFFKYNGTCAIGMSFDIGAWIW